MAAGSIIWELLMRTGSFETDTDRAAKKLKAFQKQASDTASTIKGELVSALAALGITLSFEALLNSVAEFKELEIQTGASAESLAALSVAAGQAGTTVADVAGLMNKLTKNLTGVDDESKAAGAALSALGIPIDAFKKLDPAAQVDELAKAFNGFADGSGKSAVALALFGKQGAAMLGVFKALGEEGGRQIILTQAQIDLAKEYADRQRALTATIKAYAEAGITDLLPALTQITSAAKEVAAEFFGIDTAGKKLAGESPVKEWADAAIQALAFVVDAGQGVARVFQAIAITIGSSLAAVVAYQTGNIRQALTIADEARKDIDKILSAELFSQRLARLRAAAGASTGDQSDAETKRLNRKPGLDFNGKQGGGGKEAAISEAQRYLDTLQKQVEKTSDLNAEEQALTDIQQKRIKGITPELEKQILAEARLLDAIKEENRVRDFQVANTTKLQKARLDDLDAIVKANAETQNEIALIGLDEEGRRALELQIVRVTRAEKQLALERLEATGISEQQLQVAQKEIDLLTERETLLSQRNDKASDAAATEAAKKAGDKYRDQLGDSIEQGLLDGFRRGGSLTDIFINELKAQFARTILRPIIQPIADSNNAAIGNVISGLAGLFGGGGNFEGVGQAVGRPRGGAASGSNSLERDMILLVHKGESITPKAFNPDVNGRKVGNTFVQVLPPAGHTAREERTQQGDDEIVKMIVERTVGEVDSRIRGGGSTHRALSGTYGLSRAAGAPKRG